MSVERSGYNNIRLTAYDATGGAISPADSKLDRAEGVTFATVYPGGLYSECTFYVPLDDVSKPWVVQPKNRLIIRNGHEICWEGNVVVTSIVIEEARQGYNVTCNGVWADVLMARKLLKPWADARIDADVWRIPTAAADANDHTLTEICEIDRENRIRFTPKSTRDASGNENGWSNTWFARVVYSAPTGQTVKQITASFDLQKSTQDWNIGIYNQDTAAIVWSRTTTGTGTLDHTFATPPQYVWLFLMSAAAGPQNPPSDGTVYGEFSSIVVYTETDPMDLKGVAGDIVDITAELSADKSKIGTTSLTLTPFVAIAESYADILLRAASYGDGTNNIPWAVYIDRSDKSTDGLPILVVEAIPDLDDYDYSIRLGDPELIPPFGAEQDIAAVKNWIAIQFQLADGRTIYSTPDDSADQKDTTSIANYGQREEWLTAQTSGSGPATAYAKAYLSQHKDIQWTVSSGINIKGKVKCSETEFTPASEIRAGKRIRIENFPTDLSGTGLTLLITGTSYDDSSETCRLTVGRSSSLEVWLARLLFQKGKGA